jgi:hypothetical protein
MNCYLKIVRNGVPSSGSVSAPPSPAQNNWLTARPTGDVTKREATPRKKRHMRNRGHSSLDRNWLISLFSHLRQESMNCYLAIVRNVMSSSGSLDLPASPASNTGLTERRSQMGDYPREISDICEKRSSFRRGGHGLISLKSLISHWSKES